MHIFTTVIVILQFIQVSWLKNPADENSFSRQVQNKNIKLPACQACKLLLESFQSELQLAKNSLSSNNTQLEEEVELNYSKLFETAFSHSCRHDRAKDQCLTLADKCKTDLYNWWMKDRHENPDLVNYLCVEKLHYCCPSGRYGPKCNPCPGYPDRVCNNNGKCKGNGTRKGNGQCSCDVGYSGSLCNECASSYYVSYKDEEKMLCTRCHSACEGDCSQAGAMGCVTCREGWRKDKTRGCVDVNECFSKRSPCRINEFCVNNDGSYSCLACDSACDTCTGDGPDMCDKCASGFVLKDNICIIEKTYVSYTDFTRYLTYAGLCFATYIVFQNNLLAASVIGICVAVYVTVSEYMLGTLSLTNLSFSKTMEVLENMWQKNQ